MSWKPEFKVYGDEKFYQNGVAFATKEEAEGNAKNKFSAWTMAEQWRVVESTEPVNYAWIDNKLVPVTPVAQVEPVTPAAPAGTECGHLVVDKFGRCENCFALVKPE
jgi:hypothetical protein